MSLALFGAAAFGSVIGWFLYFVNRYRKGDVQFSDLTTLAGIIGGGGITTLFGGADKALFGAYGVGLFAGFFGYLVFLLALVRTSENFGSDWFLDGRRIAPQPPYEIPGDVRPTVSPMAAPRGTAPVGAMPAMILHAAPGLMLPLDAEAGPSSAANQIVARCEEVWDANKSDCNAFVKAVAAGFQVVLHGQANDIVDQIQDAGWTRLADGVAAKRAADEGKLVIGGLKGGAMAQPSAHGHVVVVVSGPLAQNKYPSAYWGMLNSIGRKNATVNWAWTAADRDKVIYAARTV